MKLERSGQIFEEKKLKISNSMKIYPVGAKLFRAGGQADGQTNMTKLRVAFHDFVHMPKNWEVHSINKNMGLYTQLKTGNITHFVTSVFSRRGCWK